VYQNQGRHSFGLLGGEANRSWAGPTVSNDNGLIESERVELRCDVGNHDVLAEVVKVAPARCPYVSAITKRGSAESSEALRELAETWLVPYQVDSGRVSLSPKELQGAIPEHVTGQCDAVTCLAVPGDGPILHRASLARIDPGLRYRRKAGGWGITLTACSTGKIAFSLRPVRRM